MGGGCPGKNCPGGCRPWGYCPGGGVLARSFLSYGDFFLGGYCPGGVDGGILSGGDYVLIPYLIDAATLSGHLLCPQ